MKKYILGVSIILFIATVSLVIYLSSLSSGDKARMCIQGKMNETSYDTTSKEDIRRALNIVWDQKCKYTIQAYADETLEKSIDRDALLPLSDKDIEEIIEDFKKQTINRFVEEVYYIEE